MCMCMCAGQSSWVRGRSKLDLGSSLLGRGGGGGGGGARVRASALRWRVLTKFYSLNISILGPAPVRTVD